MIGSAVLLVEDHQRARDSDLARVLRSDGFDVTSVSTVDACLDHLAAALPMILLIDLGYADPVALDACHQVRRRHSVPIIAIADNDSPIDAITTLEMGADDHVIRPYRSSELIARMRAAVRRTRNQPAGIPMADAALAIGHVSIDPEARSVHVEGRPIQMSLKEFDLLYLLMANAGRVLSRDTIIRCVWQREPGNDTSTVDVHIKRLRQKIDVDGQPSLIVTIRGLGYKIDRAVSSSSPVGAVHQHCV
ncbi:MAG TPA: response regulator transcription factor [Ilumatobacter sp.]|nr:response regulator transcription factor [Ilumatobacter sp.]